MSPIRGVMYKVDRAKVHLDALAEFVELWSEIQSQAYFFHDDLERGEYIVEIRPPEMDMRGALIAGDFICCLRSSLDHLVWQLVKVTGSEPSKSICFPVVGQNTLDSQIFFTKSVFGLPEDAIAIIRSMQPYQRGDSYKLHYLWILNTLWNIDKHRHIPLHAAVTEYVYESVFTKPLRVEEFDDHMKVFFPLADKSNVKFNPRPKSEIHFGKRDEGVLVNIQNLRAIYEAIRNEIIPAFSRFFPEQKETGHQTLTW
jgi:hypothetical protein